jgi:Potato type II proteinase inhibitor family
MESGVFFSGEMGSKAEIVACREYCLINVDYMTCPSSGDQHLPASCNCCDSKGYKGCILKDKDGTPLEYCSGDGY